MAGGKRLSEMIIATMGRALGLLQMLVIGLVWVGAAIPIGGYLMVRRLIWPREQWPKDEWWDDER